MTPCRQAFEALRSVAFPAALYRLGSMFVADKETGLCHHLPGYLAHLDGVPFFLLDSTGKKYPVQEWLSCPRPRQVEVLLRFLLRQSFAVPSLGQPTVVPLAELKETFAHMIVSTRMYQRNFDDEFQFREAIEAVPSIEELLSLLSSLPHSCSPLALAASLQGELVILGSHGGGVKAEKMIALLGDRSAPWVNREAAADELSYFHGSTIEKVLAAVVLDPTENFEVAHTAVESLIHIWREWSEVDRAVVEAMPKWAQREVAHGFPGVGFDHFLSDG